MLQSGPSAYNMMDKQEKKHCGIFRPFISKKRLKTDKTGFGTEPLRDKAWQCYNKALQWSAQCILLPKMPEEVNVEGSV